MDDLHSQRLRAIVYTVAKFRVQVTAVLAKYGVSNRLIAQGTESDVYWYDIYVADETLASISEDLAGIGIITRESLPLINPAVPKEWMINAITNISQNGAATFTYTVPAGRVFMLTEFEATCGGLFGGAGPIGLPATPRAVLTSGAVTYSSIAFSATAYYNTGVFDQGTFGTTIIIPFMKPAIFQAGAILTATITVPGGLWATVIINAIIKGYEFALADYY